jgi:uncharacterized protein with PQ loop repeat
MTTLFTILGVASALAFGLCNLPQILRARKRKSTGDISLLFILLSLLGNLCAASYIIYSNIQADFYQWPQYLNYAIATTLVITLLILKLKNDGKEIKEDIAEWWENLKYKMYQKMMERDRRSEDGNGEFLEMAGFFVLVCVLSYLFYRLLMGV